MINENNNNASLWSEKIYLETSEHEITGYIFIPQIGKKGRLISDALNSEKHFLAVKDCTIVYKGKKKGEVEQHKFVHVNTSSIVILRTLENE